MPRTPAALLLDWYDRHARVLPWRIAPHGGAVADPYRVWLSEIMLQQTTVAAVTGHYARFTSRWPTVADLASADDADVMAAWAGLGYYARARNLLACARVVAHDHGGAFPDTEDGLRALPGIGAYSAASIAAIAFGRRAVVVDANIERVIARLFLIREPLPAAKPAIRTAMDDLTPDERAGDFAQAMMDLGATICTVKAPRCLLCPLRAHCRAFAAGEAEALPVKAARKARPLRHGTAWWIERAGEVWLVRRPGRGMLGGMRALPGGDWTPGALDPAPGARVVRHVFTHFELHLDIVRAPPESACTDADGGEWWPLDRLADAGLPTLYTKAAAMMRQDDREDL